MFKLMYHIKRFFFLIKYHKTNVYVMGDIPYNDIKINMPDIKNYIKRLDYNIIWDDFAIENLKTQIYLGKVKNNRYDIENYLEKLHMHNCETFEKLFWEEYVGRYWIDNRFKLSYNDFQKRLKELDKIKKYLDKHSNLQGMTGEQLQNVFNYKLGKLKVEYTWRGWGALMAAYMNSKVKERKYHYMDFYM